MTLIETKTMTYEKIEALTEEQVKEIADSVMTIKDHKVYFVSLLNYLGFSALVFANGRQIHYANEYELHYYVHDKEVLEEKMVEKLTRKLFTEAELMQPVKDYDEYRRKTHYIDNYLCEEYEHESMFFCGKPSKKQEEAFKNWKFCRACCCYTPSDELIEKSTKFSKFVEESYRALSEKDDVVFFNMCLSELFNHEAGFTEDYSSTLEALGIKYEDLSEERKKLFLQAFHKCCEETEC